jgi:hypothetical protein
LNVTFPGLRIDFAASLKEYSLPLIRSVLALARACGSGRAGASWASVSVAIAIAASARIELTVSALIGALLGVAVGYGSA